MRDVPRVLKTGRCRTSQLEILGSQLGRVGSPAAVRANTQVEDKNREIESRSHNEIAAPISKVLY